VQAYLGAERTEAFYEGHNVGFEFFGGVPRSILGGRARVTTRAKSKDWSAAMFMRW